MCRYDYVSYGGCGHSVIQCEEMCNVTLWRGGLRGELILCVPGLQGGSIRGSGPEKDETLQPTDFIGFSGSCDTCVKELEIQDNFRQRDDMFGYITGADGHCSPDAVLYFQAKQLLTTFPHLLAIDEQLTDAKMDRGPVVLFPHTIEKLTWAALRQWRPCKISGDWAMKNAKKPVSAILADLHCTSGMSPEDRRTFIHVLMNGFDIDELYKDVFKARGMPYAMYRQVGAQIKIKAKANGYEPAEKAAAVKYPRTTTVHHSRSEPLNDPFQNGSPGGAGEYYVRIDDQDSAVSLSPARPPHGRPQHTDTVECAPQTQSDSSASAAKARLQHQENPSRATQVSRGSKRSFSSLQEEDSPSTGSTCNPQQSHVGQQTIERPAQRPRYSRPIVPSPQDPEAARVQAITAASPSLLTVSVASAPRAVTSGPPQASSQAQSVPVPQQPAVQRQVGQFNMAACRAMQVQARAAHAVPLQAPTAAVVQAQAAMLQAAQARAAQPPPPRVQLVDASRAQKLQAHYRRSQAPSEIEANQTRASQFASGFNQIVGSHGLIIEAAQAGIAETLEENEEHLVDQSPVNPLPVTQSLTDPSPIDPSLAFQLPLIQQSSVQQPTIGPSLINQSANFQSSSSPPLIQQSPRQQSTIDPSLMQSATLPSSSFRPLMHQSPQTLPVGPSTATSSPAFQQASTVDMPGKGKGVLPHAVARATFFINAKEKTEAISHLTKAWTAYSQSLAGSTLKERAAMWIVNFSLNFRQHWSLSTRSGSTLRETTLAQLTRAYADARSTLLRNATSNPGAAHFQFQQGHNVVDAQAAQQQHTMRARQV